EGQQHLLESPAFFVEDDADPDAHGAHAVSFSRLRGVFPFDTDLRKQIVAGWSVFGQFFVAVRAVVTDGRSVDQHLGGAACGAWSPGEGFDCVLGAFDSAVAQELHKVSAPAAVENPLTGEIYDRVAVIDGLQPSARLHRVAFNQAAGNLPFAAS